MVTPVVSLSQAPRKAVSNECIVVEVQCFQLGEVGLIRSHRVEIGNNLIRKSNTYIRSLKRSSFVIWSNSRFLKYPFFRLSIIHWITAAIPSVPSPIIVNSDKEIIVQNSSLYGFRGVEMFSSIMRMATQISMKPSLLNETPLHKQSPTLHHSVL